MFRRQRFRVNFNTEVGSSWNTGPWQEGTCTSGGNNRKTVVFVKVVILGNLVCGEKKDFAAVTVALVERTMAIEHCNRNLLLSYIWQKLAQYFGHFKFVIVDWSHKQFRDIKENVSNLLK